MNSDKTINEYIGGKIKTYRRMKSMTLQQLADAIHKSRATVCKYESGEITLDIETLYEISEALEVGLDQLTDYHPRREEENPAAAVEEFSGKSPFFRANRLYFYFYDGRYHRLKEAVIDIHKNIVNEDGCCDASLSIHSTSPNGLSSEVRYTGNVLYSDMLIRFSFINRYNKLEQDLLYIFNPLALRDFTEGLLCGISTTDLIPCAFKCIVTLSPEDDYDMLKEQLTITTKEMRRWRKYNMFIVNNNS